MKVKAILWRWPGGGAASPGRDPYGGPRFLGGDAVLHLSLRGPAVPRAERSNGAA